MCVSYLDLMGFSIHIRLYNNIPPTNVFNKISFFIVELIIRQFWKFAYLVYFRMSEEEKTSIMILNQVSHI